jgi:hypothetical protein
VPVFEQTHRHARSASCVTYITGTKVNPLNACACIVFAMPTRSDLNVR